METRNKADVQVPFAAAYGPQEHPPPLSVNLRI